jgi:starch-binding outer membrane protein, SusD/RagB family
MHRPRFIRVIPIVVAGMLSSVACSELTVPDYNNPSIEDLTANASPTTIRQAAQGMLIGARAYMGSQNGYVSLLGIVGRESYNFDPADTRFITEMLIGPLDPGSPAFGGNLFSLRYRNIRLGNTILAAIGPVAGMSNAEKEAVRGFVKTIQAHDLLMVINTRDDLGAPIDVDIDPTGPPAAIANKTQVFARIVTLLDEAVTHLNAGGTAFPFSLGPGFAGFNTPATFLRVNRALRARVDIYMGDQENALFDPQGRAILAHPSIVADAQLQPGGARDARVGRKIATLAAPRTVQGVTTDVMFTVYNSPSAPVPIIRNEELILLRAEANIALNTPASLAAALSDINLIRQQSGGLAPLGPFVSQAAALNELLYNKRYSLLFEGGHRWIDARRYGRLNTLPLALSSHTVPARFPFPEAECLARTGGC